MPKSKTQEKVESAVQTGHNVVELIERVRDAFAGDAESDEGDEGDREEALADVLDASEEAQAQLAAALSVKATELASYAASNQGLDNEDAALAAVILRALSAHTQAEAVRSMMESPDLSSFVNVEEDLEDFEGGA